MESNLFIFGDDFELDTGDLSNRFLFTLLGDLLGVNTVEDSSVLFCMGEEPNRFCFTSGDLLLDLDGNVRVVCLLFFLGTYSLCFLSAIILSALVSVVTRLTVSIEVVSQIMNSE